MPCSPARAEANRLNALKSTGPRTTEGKRTVATNALRHGFYCEHAVATGEDAAAFDTLRQALLRKFSPQDPMELLIVDRIVLNTWKLRRLQEAETAHYQAQGNWGGEMASPAGVIANDLQEPHSAVDRFSRMEQRLENNIFRAVRELTKLRKVLEKQPELPPSPYLKEVPPQGEDEDTGETPVVQGKMEGQSAPGPDNADIAWAKVRNKANDDAPAPGRVGECTGSIQEIADAQGVPSGG